MSLRAAARIRCRRASMLIWRRVVALARTDKTCDIVTSWYIVPRLRSSPFPPGGSPSIYPSRMTHSNGSLATRKIGSRQRRKRRRFLQGHWIRHASPPFGLSICSLRMSTRPQRSESEMETPGRNSRTVRVYTFGGAGRIFLSQWVRCGKRGWPIFASGPHRAGDEGATLVGARSGELCRPGIRRMRNDRAGLSALRGVPP